MAFCALLTELGLGTGGWAKSLDPAVEDRTDTTRNAEVVRGTGKPGV